MRRLAVLMLSVAAFAAVGAGVLAGQTPARAAGPRSPRALPGSRPRRAVLRGRAPRALALPGQTCFVAGGGQCGLHPCVEFVTPRSAVSRSASAAVTRSPATEVAGAHVINRGATPCRSQPGADPVGGVEVTPGTSWVSRPQEMTAQATRGAN